MHPYPFGYNFIATNGWDLPVDGTFTSIRINYDSNVTYTSIRNNFCIVSTNLSAGSYQQFQFPSIYPATNTASNQTTRPMSLMSFTAGATNWASASGLTTWSNNWATNIPVLYLHQFIRGEN